LASLLAIEKDDGVVDDKSVLAKQGSCLENAGTAGDDILRVIR
jgi:hypothetical protein